VIFVTLGTHPSPMDRLVRTLDELVHSGTITDEVLVQGAAFGHRPRHLHLRSTLPHDEFVALVREADVVISHAGAGSLADIRLQGRVPIVVPRLSAAGEHVDDHQRRYAHRLKGQPGYVVVEDMAELPAAIAAVRAAIVDFSPPNVSRAVAALEEVADER